MDYARIFNNINGVIEQLQICGNEKPTHIFLQAGVGSLAGALTGFFASVYGEERPIITIVEPNKADCIFSQCRSK